VLESAVKQKLSDCTKYGNILDEGYANIVVFLDKKKGYNRVKDIQAIGAFMENMVLAAHGLELGAVWIGEILNQKEQVNEIFQLDAERYELMGVITLGHIDSDFEKQSQKKRERRPLEEFVDWF
jgi:nitroreductase